MVLVYVDVFNSQDEIIEKSTFNPQPIKDNEGRLAADWAQEGGCPEVSALIFDAYRQKLKAAAAEKAKAKAERKAQREAEAAARQKAARDAAAGREL